MGSIDMKALLKAMEEIEKTENISKEFLLDALKFALEAAYKEHYDTEEDVKIVIDEKKGLLNLIVEKKVVKKVGNKVKEITLEEAQKIDKKAKVGSVIEEVIKPKDFGRIAVQKGKQIIIQKLREKEKDVRYEEYSSKIGEIILGSIQKVGNAVVLDLGKLEGIMPQKEQSPTEEYRVNQKLRVYVQAVNKSDKGDIQVIVSRTSPEFVKKLFEYEIPEIAEGLIEIKSVARDAGSRTKIAVYSMNENIDPVGSCVGQKGIRIQNIINELNGEKIDVVEWNEDPATYIGSALLPAEILAVDIHSEETFAQVIVPDDQLSLAIGKGGQNVRLAANLTLWKIDIKSESQFREIIEALQAQHTNIEEDFAISLMEEEAMEALKKEEILNDKEEITKVEEIEEVVEEKE